MNIPSSKDIIKMMPFDDKFKQSLLDGFDNLPVGKKVNVIDMLYQAFFVLYDLKIEENLKKAYLKAENNQESFDSGFYKRVREQTEKELQEVFFEKTKDVDLDAVRSKLEKLMNHESTQQIQKG